MVARIRREAHASDEEAATSVPAAEGQELGLSAAFLDENVGYGGRKGLATSCFSCRCAS
jgi:hypothetical protein